MIFSVDRGIPNCCMIHCTYYFYNQTKINFSANKTITLRKTRKEQLTSENAGTILIPPPYGARPFLVKGKYIRNDSIRSPFNALLSLSSLPDYHQTPNTTTSMEESTLHHRMLTIYNPTPATDIPSLRREASFLSDILA